MASDPKLDALIRGLDPELAPTVKALRALVNREAPELREGVKWGNPVWTGQENCVCIMLYDDHVNLGFFRGAELAEKFPRLEGTGKGLRHVKILSLEDTRSPDLLPILRAAVELDSA